MREPREPQLLLPLSRGHHRGIEVPQATKVVEHRAPPPLHLVQPHPPKHPSLLLHAKQVPGVETVTDAAAVALWLFDTY